MPDLGNISLGNASKNALTLASILEKSLNAFISFLKMAWNTSTFKIYVIFNFTKYFSNSNILLKWNNFHTDMARIFRFNKLTTNVLPFFSIWFCTVSGDCDLSVSLKYRWNSCRTSFRTVLLDLLLNQWGSDVFLLCCLLICTPRTDTTYAQQNIIIEVDYSRKDEKALCGLETNIGDMLLVP